MSRRCDAIGCGMVTQNNRFMCTAHWFEVPEQVRQTINRRYRFSANAHQLMRDVAYLEACATAIEQLAIKAGQPTENSYRRVLNVLQRKVEVT